MTRETDHPPPPVLFKFGQKKYLDPLLKEGIVSFAAAATYGDSGLTDGQRDDETIRRFLGDPSKHIVTIGEGDAAEPVGGITSLELTWSLKGRDGEDLKYYMWCASLEYQQDLLGEFQADCCVRIHDVGAFGDRVLSEARRCFPRVEEHPGCDLYGRNVEYFEDGEIPFTSEQKKLIFYKQAKYARQCEFRFIFATDPKKPLPERIQFNIGPLHDIAEFFP